VTANEVFGDAVRRAGAEFIRIGTAAEFRAAVENPDIWHPRKGIEIVFRQGLLPAVEPTIEELRARRRDDTVLVAGTFGLAARVLRDAGGPPLATTHLSPSIFQSVHRVPRLPGMPVADWSPTWWKRLWWRMSDRVVDPLLARPLNEIRARLGLAPLSRVLKDWIHSPDLVLCLFPDWFGPPQPDWPRAMLTGFVLFDDDGRPGDPDLEGWIDAGEPPVVFTAGTANVTAHRFFREAVAACVRLGRRGLLVTSRRESVPRELPGHVRWAPFAPFSRALPRAAALVSHGGVGTIAQGLAAGNPQLVTPIAFDQFDNASRVADLGAGAVLAMRRFTGARAADALRRLLGDATVATRCRTLADRFVPDAAGRAAALVEGLGARSSG
jgi:UDP:flavonoid glycosyltransferase YjiC (YdhE family)